MDDSEWFNYFADAIQSGQIQVSSFESLGTFGQLFPM